MDTLDNTETLLLQVTVIRMVRNSHSDHGLHSLSAAGKFQCRDILHKMDKLGQGLTVHAVGAWLDIFSRLPFLSPLSYWEVA